MKQPPFAEMIAEGGRDGKVEAADGKFSVQLSSDEQPGSLTPEHLFGGAYAACFLGALEAQAKSAHLEVKGATVTAKVHLTTDERGGSQLHVELRAALPGIEESAGEKLLHQAHERCPYSQATRGNVTVDLHFD